MPVEEGDPALVDPQALPHAIAEHEARIEHRDHRLAARLHLAVDVDQDRRVARIAGAVVQGTGHGATVPPHPTLGKSGPRLGRKNARPARLAAKRARLADKW